MNSETRELYDLAKSRAICAGLRFAILLGGVFSLFPVGVWLMLESTGWPQWGGGFLCTVAGVLASGLPGEKDRAERLTREAERLRWQGEA